MLFPSILDKYDIKYTGSWTNVQSKIRKTDEQTGTYGKDMRRKNIIITHSNEGTSVVINTHGCVR